MPTAAVRLLNDAGVKNIHVDPCADAEGEMTDVGDDDDKIVTALIITCHLL